MELLEVLALVAAACSALSLIVGIAALALALRRPKAESRTDTFRLEQLIEQNNYKTEGALRAVREGRPLIERVLTVDGEVGESKNLRVRIGTEIGAAAKNVMGIAAGVLDGGGVSTLKGPLMSRGAREVARLIKALGGSELSAYGLAHLGDYETTLFSRHSHNRMYGEMLVKGQKFEKLAEGVMTAAAMKKLGEKVGVELPITEAVYDVCFSDKPKTGEEWKTLCMERISRLFSRDTKFEF